MQRAKEQPLPQAPEASIRSVLSAKTRGELTVKRRWAMRAAHEL